MPNRSPKRGLKIGIALATAAAVFFTIFNMNGGIGSKKYAGQTLHLYNWGEYMGENSIQDFEEYTGCKVVEDMFDCSDIIEKAAIESMETAAGGILKFSPPAPW